MKNRFATVIGIGVTALAANALADDQAAPDTAPASPPTMIVALEGAKTLDAAELGEQRAKAKLDIENLTLIAPQQNGVVVGNSAVNTTTGANAISDTAFAGASGIINTIQNTGNNVLIQSSTIVNVALQQ
jgi:hypothetical protein